MYTTEVGLFLIGLGVGLIMGAVITRNEVERKR